MPATCRLVGHHGNGAKRGGQESGHPDLEGATTGGSHNQTFGS